MNKTEKTERTKEKILAAALREFGAEGYAGVSLNNICAKYNLPKGLVYHNFASKEEIYLACVEKCFSLLVAYISSCGEQQPLELYMESRCRFFYDNPDLAGLFFEAVLRPPSALRAKIAVLKSDFDALNKRLFEQSLSRYRLRKSVTKETALVYYEFMQQMFNGFFGGAAYENRTIHEIMGEHEKMLGQFLDVILYGIVEKE